jgi:cell division protein FtsL
VDNQSAARNDGKNPDSASSPADITKANDTKTTEPASAQQLTDVEKQMSGFEKSTLRWAKVAVLMSFLAAVFVCAQWYEMHQGGIDTHTLAVATKTQADITKRVTEANFEAICDMRTDTNLPEMQQTTDIVNTGGVNALTVTAHLEVTRNSLPDLKLLAPIETIELNEPEILKNKGLPAVRTTPLRLTKDQRRRILNDVETIVVRGTVDYDNGFGTVKHKQVCSACVADPFQADRQQPPLPDSQWTCTWETACEGVTRQLQAVAAERDRRRQQHQPEKPN